MKAKPCILLFHTRCTQVEMGKFPSIRKAKIYVSECWEGPYTIIPIKKIEKGMFSRR